MVYVYPRPCRCSKCGFEQTTGQQQHHPYLAGSDGTLFCPACALDWMNSNFGKMEPVGPPTPPFTETPR